MSFAEAGDNYRHNDNGAEYGPRPLKPFGPQPISDDDDELQLAPLKSQSSKAAKPIRIATISKASLMSLNAIPLTIPK